MTVEPRRRLAAPLDVVALVGLTLLASLSGLRNGFTFDDEPIILANPRVHTHDWQAAARVFATPYWPPELGGGLYRPLTMEAYIAEWWAGNGSPFLFHAVNVVLYVAVVVAVYVLAARVLPRGAAWLAAALFAVHPVHVEVVANVVGQAELLAALATIVAAACYVGCRTSGRPRLRPGEVVGLTLLYLVGCLSKEHAIVLPALLVAAELTVIERPADRRALWPLAVSLGAAAAAYIAVRAAVLHGMVGDIPAVEFRDASVATRWWTMLGIGGQWLRLLVWPAHLAAIYSPPAVPVLSYPTLAVVPALVCIVLVIVFVRRAPPAVQFGIAWAGICLLPTSNVFVATGVFLAERTLFLPSVGVALAAGAAASMLKVYGPLSRGFTTASPGFTTASGGFTTASRGFTTASRGLISAVAGLAAAAVIVAGAWRSAARQPVWHDDARFFAQALVDEPRSYAAHYQTARMLFATGQQEAAVREAQRAVQLYGGDPELAGVLGRAYARAGRCDEAVPLLRQTVAQLPSHMYPRARLRRCLEQLGDSTEASALR